MEKDTLSVSREQLLSAIKADFAGLNTRYRLANGVVQKRVYLDSAATCLPLKAARWAANEFLSHYANTHSTTHFSARISTSLYHWAHERLMAFVGADPANYTCVFIGSGSTAGFNRVSRLFQAIRPERDTVLVSLMEHHSNDLPHRRTHKRVVQIPLDSECGGCLSLRELERLLDKHGDAVNYIAVTSASNVTGVCNPISEITKLAHDHGVYILVDASQAIAHRPFKLSGDAAGGDIDAFIFSGHKLYAPGSPGVIICKKSLFDKADPYEIGGGTVERVYSNNYELVETLPEREEAGTPNILGAVTLAFTVDILDRVGMDTITFDENRLLQRFINGLSSIPGTRSYGVEHVPLTMRTPTMALSLKGFDHGLLATILNDYYNIAVRNQCFCAHPYVRELIKQDLWELDEEDFTDATTLRAKQGLVRVSLGLYNTDSDVDYLLYALADINKKRDFYCNQYQLQPDGNYRHVDFRPNEFDIFDPNSVATEAVNRITWQQYFSENRPNTITESFHHPNYGETQYRQGL